ncbi:MAG: AbrB/MazE/SpoVT family DNA-binding domain-containing protein [Nitrospirae bacterium]|nr:AbrB/MazE/SpoVT family DNA-binding domain-containing protein [Nitrospirota bacterium]
MNVAKISVRGQVAVPKAIREKLSIKEGDTILFEEREGEVYIRKVKNFFDLEGTLPPLRLSMEEIRNKAMEEMAKEAL